MPEFLTPNFTALSVVDLLGDVDDHYHSYCTYIPVTILGAARHSLHVHRHCPEVDFKAPSFSSSESTNKTLHPPLYTATNITRFPKSYTTHPTHTCQRSLTHVAVTPDDEMTDAPGSPPGLTGSKSSKSSSYRSSSLSGPDGILSDITNFEDIGLDGDHLFGRNLHGMEKPMRPVAGAAPPMATMRELTNAGKNRPYPLLQGPKKEHSATYSASLPIPGPPRRGLRSPSTPSLAMAAMSNRTLSRSPSPNGVCPVSRPMSNPAAPRRPRLAPIKAMNPQARRGSWQPSRKSIKELEAEYNDSDEDLPDDASLWNVPLSPRPPTERTTSISASNSPKISPCTSPEPPSPLHTSSRNYSSQPPRTAPVLRANSPLAGNMTSPPSSPRKPKTLLRGASTGTMPDHFGFAASRTKSWNVALSELSEEAKSLTEAFENHAVLAEQQHEEAVQNGETSFRPSLEKLSRSRTSTVELPPLRKNNVMIDPLPISKEKEKVLSRTRPSWLPPKSQKEEKKHLKEYQRMMEFSLEAERKRAAKVADSQCAKDDTKSALLRIWEEHVLPNWDQVVREPRTRELWWRGVAPKSRAQVWQKAVGNELALTEVTYKKALQRAKDVEARLVKPGKEELDKEKVWFDAIQRDVRVAFPELKIFQPSGPLHGDLVDVLMAYSMYRSDVGYSHGTHLIAALLSLTLPDPTSVFLTLCNLLNRPLPLAFLTGDPSATAKAYSLTDALLSHKFPRLHAHLFDPAPTGLGLTAHEALEPMMRTLFLGPGNGLGVERAVRVWDVMVFDGDGVIIRTAVAVLGALEGKLYGGKEEVLGVLGWGDSTGKGAWDVGSEESFMALVRNAGKEEKGKDM